MYGETRAFLFSVSPGCSLWLTIAVTDLFAEVRNLFGDVRSRSVTPGRRDQQADSYPDAHSDQQSTYFAERSGIFFARKNVSGAAQTFGRDFISLPRPAFDVVHVVWHTLPEIIKQIKAGIEQDPEK